MDAAIHAGVVLLAVFGCADDDGAVSSGRFQRGSISRPGMMYWKDQMIVRIWNPQQIPTLARDVDRYKNATQLKFDFSGTTDEEFAAVPPLPLVEVVEVSEEEAITDKSLRVLAKFPKLKHLSLGRTAITGEGFRHFVGEKGKKRRGPRLEDLQLAHNKLTDNGLRELARIATLRTLWISYESAITAQGVLAHLPKLEQPLNLTISYHDKHRLMTSEEKQRLVENMPHCQVMFGIEYGESKRLRHRIGSGDPFAVPEEGQERAEPSPDEKKD